MSWPTESFSGQLVLAVEGLDTLLVDGDAAGVLAAWSGTDWTSATAGMCVDTDLKHEANPWEPFKPGGSITVSIADDTIGVLTHRTTGGFETKLTGALDQDDTTINVQDTSAADSSGTVHIGTEAITYTGKTSTTFTGCTRGKWSPFGTATGSSRYAHSHRVASFAYGPSIAPDVTQYPREWVGRWVGLWLHRRVGGTLQTKADAMLVFAGRLVEVRDDADTLCTVLVADSVLTDLASVTLGRDLFSGEVADGIYLPAAIGPWPVEFTFKDSNGSAWKTANALTVVASGAVGANQINAGYYSHSALFTKLNQWWASELAATRLYGTYSAYIAPTQGTQDSLRTKIKWRIPAGSVNGTWGFTMPKAVAIFLGFDSSATNDALGDVTVGDLGTLSTDNTFCGDSVPLRSWVTTGLSVPYLRVENVSGAFQDQLSTLPAGVGPPPYLAAAGGQWGLFLFNDQAYVRGKVTDNGDGTFDLQYAEPALALDNANALDGLMTFAKRLDDPTPTKIRQVLMFEMQTSAFLNALVYSGGTPTYNHATYDSLPYGCGLGYPGGLFGTAWETSVANMPGATKPIAPFIDKPTKLSEILGSDLVLRHVFPTWKDGGLRLACWQTPTASLAVAALTEANKMEPADREAGHRVTTLLSDRWARNLIKIEYNRDPISGSYKSTINIEDRRAIDARGDQGSPFTISARNTSSAWSQTGAGIEDIVPNTFIPGMTSFTRPMRTLKRSAGPPQWGLTPGDIVTVTDGFARDPSTGQRRVTNRPATVISHRGNFGGARPDGSTGPMVGELELMFVETNRVYAYGPSALVDSSANSGGFTAGYNSATRTLRCVAHTYSESSEAVDASQFAVNDVVTVHEIDPSDPAVVLSWTLAITGVSGSDLTLASPGLSAFDSTKTYRVIPAAYSLVQTSQRDKAFQADDADGLVENLSQAYQYGIVTSSIAATASSHTTLPERHAALTFGDGKAYDVGSLVGLAHMADNLIDHKTAIQSPLLSNVALTNTTYSTGSGYKLVMMAPLFLTRGLLSNQLVRYLKIAPWFRSSDGTATSVRVTVAQSPCTDDTINDADRGLVYADSTWSTSSTTWQQGTPAYFTVNLKGTGSVVWVMVECNYKSESRGLAECNLQERTVF